MKKRALITGISGQDGSYLAELLLEKDYEVYGMVRRTSTVNLERIEAIKDRLHLLSGDLLDLNSLMGVLHDSKPDEVYNLAAQSFAGTSWSQPIYTGEVTGLGVTRMLDAIRAVKSDARFYQATSSEMFGKVRESPQNEDTPLYPRSPYGVAKAYGHWITINYRESYGLHATSGILFNHECVTAETPVIVRKNGLIDILPIEDVVPHKTKPESPKHTTELNPEDRFEVWDKDGWTFVTCMTATWNGYQKRENKTVHRIAARGAFFEATSDHVGFLCKEGKVIETPIGNIEVGDRVALVGLPEPTDIISMTEDEAWLLGIICAEGSITGNSAIQVTNQDQSLLDEVAACWYRVTGGTTSRRNHPSGFPTGKDVTQMRLQGAGWYVQAVRDSLYTRTKKNRIPIRVLNASRNIRLAFIKGYYAGDGLKAGNGVYAYKGIKTWSATIAMGMYWLAKTTLNQRAVICIEERDEHLYYQLNLNSPNVQGNKGQHLLRPLDEVVKTRIIKYDGWLFDLATETGTFHAGVGQGWIHNSPRRGLEFVTRKITNAAARIRLGLDKELRLGNLETQRDWGYAGDYVEAMWRMLQQDKADDYVIATGVTHTITDLLNGAFGCFDLNWRDYVVQDPAFMRPVESDLLVGNYAKARAVLNWEPTTDFKTMIERMAQCDFEKNKALA